VTREAYIVQADALCSAADEAIDAVGEPGDLAEVAMVVPRVTDIAVRLLADLRALARPPGADASLDRLYGILDDQIELLARLRDAAAAEDATLVETLVAEVDRADAEADRLARGYGFTACGVADEDAGPEPPGVADDGDVVVSYTPTGDEDLDVYLSLLRDSGVLEQLAAALNSGLALPRDLTISVEEVAGPAFYPEADAIAFPPSFVALLDGMFSEVSSDLDEITGAIFATGTFVLFHELGHAFVEYDDLPITGREEDAVDQLATYLSTQVDPELGGQLALAGALFFGLSAVKREEFERSDFWDEHSLDEQRFFNIVCWVYGSNPESFADEAAEAGLGDERLARCPDEYAQLASSWERLMAPFVKG
jgi:hypothetical protein